MAFPDDDLALVYADTFVTVPVTVGEGAGAVDARGFLDLEPTELALASGLEVETVSAALRILVAVVPVVAQDDVVTADSVQYVVRQARRPGDGREWELLLVEVQS